MGQVAYKGARRRIVWGDDAKGHMNGKNYFDDLDDGDQRKFKALFERLGDFGVIQDKRKYRSEGNKLFVFKIFKRRLVAFDHGRDVVIVSGFTKKSDKVPPGELERADRLRSEYLANQDKN